MRLGNEKLRAKLFDLSGGLDLMHSLGFTPAGGGEHLELPVHAPMATLTRCHEALLEALDLLARRAGAGTAISAAAATAGPAGEAAEGAPLLPRRQSTLVSEIERLWKAQEQAAAKATSRAQAAAETTAAASTTATEATAAEDPMDLEPPLPQRTTSARTRQVQSRTALSSSTRSPPPT